MPNPLFNRFGNMMSNSNNQVKPSGNIISQIAKVKKDPGFVLDIMLQNGKINYQQYNELQPYRNNLEMIVKYLINNGKANEINQAENAINQINNSN